MNDISLVMLMKDEEALIVPLLETVRPWVNQMIVVDTGSTDASIELAQQAGALVVTKPLAYNFAAARNYGLSLVQTSWALQIDTDETPSRYLLEWIANFVTSSMSAHYDAVQVRRFNLLDGQPLAGREYEWHTRLFRCYLRYVGTIHESVVGAREVLRAPQDFLLLHSKTMARQQRQNKFYEEWKEVAA